MLDALRRRLERDRWSRNPLRRLVVRAVRAPWYVWQAATDGFYRSTLWNRWRRPERLHLTCNYTQLDRYPEIFARVKSELEARSSGSAPLRILSFGCSTGEEPLTLRRYFPAATIVGADISEWNLRQARRQVDDPAIHFVRSDSPALAETGPFDAIFCMAVLLRVAHRMEPPPSTEDVYPVDVFDRQVAELDALLRPDGLLVLHHANYHLATTPVGARYEPLPNQQWSERDEVPKYGRDHRLLESTDTPHRIHRKLR